MRAGIQLCRVLVSICTLVAVRVLTEDHKKDETKPRTHGGNSGSLCSAARRSASDVGKAARVDHKTKSPEKLVGPHLPPWPRRATDQSKAPYRRVPDISPVLRD